MIDSLKVLSLKRRRRSGPVWLIGNGPSVDVRDLEHLVRFQNFAVNRFHLSYESHRLRPTLTFVEDKLMIKNHHREIVDKCGSRLLLPEIYSNGVKASNVIRYRLLPNSPGVTMFSSNLLRGNFFGGSVVFGALQTAMWMGFRTIFLYGMDHSFVVPSKRDKGDPRLVIDSGERNHFIENYRAPGETWATPDVETIEKGFLTAKKHADANRVSVYNATRGGYLEVFERIPFESAVKLSERHLN